jgi:hypothetical protein
MKTSAFYLIYQRFKKLIMTTVGENIEKSDHNCGWDKNYCKLYRRQTLK